MRKTILYLSFAILFISSSAIAQLSYPGYNEQHRPQIHFSPERKWMNDPNGLVYFNNTYHMFFQHYPDSTVWGPMHWGHAVSKDLVHWQQQPIALYPDSLGYIYSGSVVVDSNNTSGFGQNGNIPLVAVFTHSNPILRKEGKNSYQYQSLAYSLDNGYSWVKYAGNPVLKNPGIKDFRDPKVMWYKSEKKWIMTLATKDRVTFYSSPDLKEWTKESEFGQDLGAHGGVWECPDLLPFKIDGKEMWALLVSINPGGPNGGSATQYFVGSFDGRKFIPYTKTTKWLDYGTDNYAGVTWSNTGERKLFIGWMSNWKYANLVPTGSWRSAMTVPRELKLKKVDDDYFLASEPVKELNNIVSNKASFKNIEVKRAYFLSNKLPNPGSQCQLKLTLDKLKSFDIVISNNAGEELIVGYDEERDQYYIDRTNSGKTAFEKGFAGIQIAPRLSKAQKSDITLIIDAASVELFCDGGLTTMTAIFFPNKVLGNIQIRSKNNFHIEKLDYAVLNRIWK